MYNLCMDKPRTVSTHLQKIIAKGGMFSHLHLFELQPVVVKKGLNWLPTCIGLPVAGDLTSAALSIMSIP